VAGPLPCPERRTFYFAEAPPPAPPGPRFLPLRQPPACPRPAPEGWQFDLDHLRACFAQPTGWKQRHQFPADVAGVLAPAPAARGRLAWRQAALAHAEELWLVLALSDHEPGEQLLGFGTHPDGWRLHASEPALALGDGWREVWPELADEPDAQAWRRAWQAWAEAHRLSADEAAACHVEQKGARLRVRAPQFLAARLRTVPLSESWVSAGVGSCGAVARIEAIGGERGA
jgi:hypothetical protein